MHTEQLTPYVEALLGAGFKVWAVNTARPARFVYVAKDIEGPFAIVQEPTHRFDPIQVDLPIKPSREYGSSVLVDDVETPAHAVHVVTNALKSYKVTVRFCGLPEPVVPNLGRKCLDNWPGGVLEL